MEESAPQPVIAERTPAVLELDPKVYSWCACGKSKNQPFCDGSHKEEGIFTPIRFEITEKRRVALCRCKRSANKPYCDGTHKTLSD